LYCISECHIELIKKWRTEDELFYDETGGFTAVLKKWWVESDFKAPNLPLLLRLNPGVYMSPHRSPLPTQYANSEPPSLGGEAVISNFIIIGLTPSVSNPRSIALTITPPMHFKIYDYLQYMISDNIRLSTIYDQRQYTIIYNILSATIYDQ
jgi:hypothetical protein